MERAEPSIISIAFSMSLALRFFILASAISRTWARVMEPATETPGALEPLESLAAQVLSSDQVRTAVAAGITRVETRLVDELTARERATAPFTVGVDIGAELNARLDEVPVVGAFAPDLEIAPVEVEVVDAATFDQVRTAYAGIRFAGDWLAWIGAALLAVGMALSRRRARYAGWSVLGLAVGALAVAFAVGAVAPRIA